MIIGIYKDPHDLAVRGCINCTLRVREKTASILMPITWPLYLLCLTILHHRLPTAPLALWLFSLPPKKMSYPHLHTYQTKKYNKFFSRFREMISTTKAAPPPSVCLTEYDFCSAACVPFPVTVLNSPPFRSHPCRETTPHNWPEAAPNKQRAVRFRLTLS